MTGSFDTDVFVVGGGPAGLAAAIAARRAGFRVIVADVLLPPLDKACGEGLMPDSVAELAGLGVSLERYRHGAFRGIRFVGAEGEVQANFPRGLGLGVRRTTLHTALIDHAAHSGVEMIWGTRVDGISSDSVVLNARRLRTRYVVGADGQHSLVRAWAGLEKGRVFERRIALRQHFKSPRPLEYVEVHWGDDSQAYVTPVAADEICVAMISKCKINCMQSEIARIPSLRARLENATPSSTVRGALSLSNRFKRVCAGNVALLGDASGCVDAITGEGLALSFRQALSLANAMAAGDLRLYEKDHRAIEVLPQFTRRAMLLMDKSSGLRRRTLRAFHEKPALFDRMLSVHVGELPLRRFGTRPLASFGWQLLTV